MLGPSDRVSVNGRVAAVSPDGAVVEVGGIGLAVQCTPGTIARLQVGEQARLSTSLIVREDSLTLYGFADDDERQPVRAAADRQRRRPAAGAGGAGHPPAAGGPPRGVDGRRQGADAGARHRQEGRRAADPRAARPARRHHAPTPRSTAAPPAGLGPVTPVAPWRDQLTSALVGLGWSVREADGAVAQLAPVADEQIAATGGVEVAVLLRQALQLLGLTQA